jgi:hypothetical protein
MSIDIEAMHAAYFQKKRDLPARRFYTGYAQQPAAIPPHLQLSATRTQRRA